MEESGQAEWHYVGNYGQLGPLTMENLSELIADCVIGLDTFVWRPGMRDWEPAGNIPQLVPLFKQETTPPPPPTPGSRSALMGTGPGSPPGLSPAVPHTPMRIDSGYAPMTPYGSSSWSPSLYSAPKSDKNRLTAALLNVIPGVGRLYLGHVAVGVLQLITSVCGFGFLWSWVDGIYILVGGLRHDGYGRELPD